VFAQLTRHHELPSQPWRAGQVKDPTHLIFATSSRIVASGEGYTKLADFSWRILKRMVPIRQSKRYLLFSPRKKRVEKILKELNSKFVRTYSFNNDLIV
jgi:hypothetical protein